ncbi:MAG: hexose kinase [Pedococcus sp.]
MILTITPNPALDVTYDVERVVPHESHRVLSVQELAGGKGINVASVLHLLGQDVVVTGVVGGSTGEQVRADLDRRGIPHRFAQTASQTRRTTTVVSREDGEATAFNEPGWPWPEGAWARLLDHVATMLDELPVRVLVASGSVPPGVPDHAFADLTRVGRDAGVAVIVDASRTALLGALPAAPDVVKPNREELLGVTGVDDPIDGAKMLQELGARHVVVSLGADGIVAVAPSGIVLRARLGERLRGNATGAGDAAVAALASALASGAEWAAGVADAVAWSAAAVLQPTAGLVDPEDIDRLRAAVHVDTWQL